MTEDTRQATALAMCQMMLRQRQAETNIALQRLDIQTAVAQVAQILDYADIDIDGLTTLLEERFTVYAPDHRTLGEDDDHQAWLPAQREVISWRYWDRYKLYLNQNVPPHAVDSIDRVTDDVLQRLEAPARPGMWDRRGLVMGHVQSGKTANYCGLIAKAADAGYKVVIVLAGIHNSLRSQTQIRLDEGFLGFMSEPLSGTGQSFRRTGVGLVDAGIVANTATNRSERGDFNRKVANQFGIHPGGLPLLFVVKKNVSVLRNLNNWISSCANAEEAQTQRRFVRDVPLLVIDDEADLASIDTRLQQTDEDGNPDPEHDPTATNKQIRRLLRAFEKSAYVGYTATPFANIYIYDRGYTPELGPDLFPRSFIVSIPPPTNYMGPARVFGVSPDEDAGLEEIQPLPVVRIVTDHAASLAVDETAGWMPPRLTARTEHLPRCNGHDTVPPSLREAVQAFILAAAIRSTRNCRPRHNSMLIHVVRYTKVQTCVAGQVESALNEILQRLRNGDGARTPTIIDEFRVLWEADFMPTTTACNTVLGESEELPEWHDVVERLLPVTGSIRVKVINGSAGDVLDYEEHKETGLNVIAIGGDKLARGLTLEGLTVSYFLRASRMYDTLMQMGRWFGYREHYAHVCRLYTTTELLEWFTHITAASVELQAEFEHMVNVGGTPKDYGLKIRSHPALLVTSAVKMRHGTEMRLSFSGDISETIIYKRSQAWIGRNLTATDTWLSKLGAPTGEGTAAGGYTWVDISAPVILEFLTQYTSHEDARRVDTALLSKYIRAQNEEDELIQWTVHLCSSRLADALPYSIAGRQVGQIVRSPFLKSEERFTIRRLVSPSDEAIDLTQTQLQEALRLTQERWANNTARQRTGTIPERPGGREIRQVRDNKCGLLLLYPVRPPAELFPADTPPLVGIALSFPRSDTAREITYTVNNVFTRQGGDDESL